MCQSASLPVGILSEINATHVLVGTLLLLGALLTTGGALGLETVLISRYGTGLTQSS